MNPLYAAAGSHFIFDNFFEDYFPRNREISYYNKEWQFPVVVHLLDKIKKELGNHALMEILNKEQIYMPPFNNLEAYLAKVGQHDTNVLDYLGKVQEYKKAAA